MFVTQEEFDSIRRAVDKVEEALLDAVDRAVEQNPGTRSEWVKTLQALAGLHMVAQPPLKLPKKLSVLARFVTWLYELPQWSVKEEEENDVRNDSR